MAGMAGYSHICTENPIEKGPFRLSLRESSFSKEECDMIWDFYVARSFAASTGIAIPLDSYGWKNTTNKTDGYPALESELSANAGISSFCIIRANTIKDTLHAMDLSGDRICISHPRAVLMQNYTCDPDENERVRVDSKESRINAIFRHIRNSFAHGNTYFFDNDMCLLEDKDKNKVSAEILIPNHSLFDWIFIVDRNGINYKRL